MTPQEAAPLIDALKPLISRVRRDKTAVKLPDGSSRWTGDGLTVGMMAKHLNGGPARGVCPIREGESVTLVALLDFDSHKGESSWQEMLDSATRVSFALESQGYPSTMFRSSGGKGVHLYLLWDHAQDAASVRAMLREQLEMLGLREGAGGVRAGQVEIFPKQDSVAVGGFGNQFILPLAGKSEFLDPIFDFAPMGKDALRQWCWPMCRDVPKVAKNIVFRPAPGSDKGVQAEEIEKVRSALDAIPNCDLLWEPDYDEWFKLGCAVHEATGGSPEGLNAFQSWSAQSEKHNAEFTERRVWRYLQDAAGRGTAITRGTLFATASRFGWAWLGGINADGFEDVTDEVIAANDAKRESQALAAQKQDARLSFEAKTVWKTRVDECADELTLVESICPQIARDKSLTDLCRSVLAEVVKSRLAVFGSKVGIAQCRKLVAPVVLRKIEESDAGWAKGWVFVADGDRFFELGKNRFLSMTSFNAFFNRYTPPPAEGSLRKTAAWTALEDLQIPTADRAHYVPWLGDSFTLDGSQCVNLFSPDSVPQATERLSKIGEKARDAVLRHLSLITGGRKDVVDVLVNWMAHNVQHPGKKIRWAPLIKGIEGDGKSLIGQLMAAVIGAQNVKNISPTVLSSNFTEWAMGACVGVLEEIRLTGHSRYDVLNALKPYVTNDSVAIHPKGRNEFNTLNTMNYIAFTNHSDALPLNETDRRWFVVFTPFTDRAGFSDAVGGEPEMYFDELFGLIGQCRADLRRWLLSVQIPATFRANGVAPATEEKRQMVAMSVTDDEDLIQTVMEAGAIGVGKTVISTACLTNAVKNLGIEVEVPRTSSLSRTLIKMGWLKVPSRVKWRSEAHRVWVKGVKDCSPAAIRDALEVTTVAIRDALEVTSVVGQGEEKMSVNFD